MNPTIKTELISIAHTFVTVAGAYLVANIGTLDITHLTKGVLLAFAIGMGRSVVKTMWNTYFPTIVNSTIEQLG